MSARPLYSFGYGLSYTTFDYANLSVERKDRTTFNVSLDVTNTGTRDGEEVAQLYLHDELASTTQPLMQLKHFKRRSEEHTSELQSRQYLVCRLLLEKK